MFNSVYRVFNRRNSYVVRVVNPIHDKLCYVQLNPFSSQAEADIPRPIAETAKEYSCLVNYLVNTFGFSQAKAFTASKYLKVDSIEKPESVVEFLKNYGLKAEEIASIARHFPQILLCDPQKTLLPKVEFFQSLGISQSELNKIFLTAPGIFKRSLTKQIEPSFKYIKSLFESSGTSFGFTKRLAAILCCDLESQLIPNVEILRYAGVPDSKIIFLLQYQPRALMVDTERFRKVVEEVKQMNISPALCKFIIVVIAFRAMTKSTWDKKLELYKKWGWSEDDIILAFERNPYCMMLSMDKITAMMNFLVNEMGFPSSFVLKRPDTVSYSLEKRIKPRCSVYKVLLGNGLVKEGSYLNSIFNLTEEQFLKRFVHRYENEAPGLLQVYHKELVVSES